MADVKTKFVGDAQQAVKEIEKLERSMVKLREKNAQLAAGTRETAKASRSANSALIAGASSAVASLLSVQRVVGFVKQAYAEWHAEVQKLGQAHAKVTTEMVHQFAGAGILPQGAEWQEFVERFPGATKETVLAGMKGVTASAVTADTAKRKELISTAVGLQPVFGDAAQAGELVGHLAKLNPEMKSGDLGDIAATLLADAGDYVSDVTSKRFLEAGELFKKSGAASTEEFLGLGLEALTKNISPRVLDTVGLKLGDRGEVITRKRGQAALTPEQEAHNRFAGAASGREALELLMNDPAVAQQVLGPDNAERLALLGPDAMQRGATRIRGAMETDAMDTARQQLKEFEAGRDHLRRQTTAANLEKAGQKSGEEGDLHQVVVDRLTTQGLEEGQGFVRRGIARAELAVKRVMHDIAPQTATGQQYERMVRNAEQQTTLLEQQNNLLRDLKPRPALPDPDEHRERK